MVEDNIEDDIVDDRSIDKMLEDSALPSEPPKKIDKKNHPMAKEKIGAGLVRSITETYYDFQGQRIITGNRILAQSTANGISKEDLDKFGVTELFRKAKSFEKDIEDLMKLQLPLHPIYEEYLSKIYGIGPIIASGLIAYVADISKFDNISKLWQYCYDEKTEVMTKSGFKLFSDVTYEDEIMTLNPENDNMEYQKPIAMFIIPYRGKMVHFQGRAYDFMVTPEHRMYVRYGSDKFMFAPAIAIHEQLKNYPYSKVELKRDGIWKGEEVQTYDVPSVESRPFRHPKTGMLVTHCGVRNPKNLNMNTWLKFMGWYLAEGSCNVHGRRKQARVQISQTLVNPENRVEIKEILNEVGFNPYVNDKGFDIGSRSLYEHLLPLGNSYTHYIPEELKNLPPRQLRILVDTMMKGDGDTTNRLFTVSKKMADDFQEIVMKCGYAASVSFRGDGYRVTIIKRDTTPMITKTPTLVDYDGYVYDLTVPKHHVIMVRRNGKAGWSSFWR